MRRALITATIVGIATLACQRPESPSDTPPPIAEAEEGVQAFWSAYVAAAKAGDASALGQLHAPDVYLVEPGMPTLRGRDAVAAAFGEGFTAVKYSEINIRPALTEWHGERVFQVGTYDDRFTMQGQAMRSYGRYSGVFVRDSAGKWLVSRAVVAMDSSAAVK